METVTKFCQQCGEIHHFHQYVVSVPRHSKWGPRMKLFGQRALWLVGILAAFDFLLHA